MALFESEFDGNCWFGFHSGLLFLEGASQPLTGTGGENDARRKKCKEESVTSKFHARSYFDTVGNSGDDGVLCEDESLTVQAPKDDVDINTIVKRYLRTGEMPGVRQGVFADISELTDLADAMQMVNEAEQLFMELPAEVRKEFDNDPRRLVEFAQNPANRDRAMELGLVDRPPVAPSQPDPVPAKSTKKVDAKTPAPSNSEE